MIGKQLGKIQHVHVGFGGYQDAQFGITFTIGGEGWGVGDFWGYWTDRPEHAQWTLNDQYMGFAKVSCRIIELLKAARVNDVAKLKGKPVEVTFEGNALKSWRILTEVL